MTSQDIEFPLFPGLPTEVRDLIWTMSFTSRCGRMVEVRNRQAQHLEGDELDTNGNQSLHLWSPSPPPEIAYVCHEARDAAKRVAMRAGQFHFESIFFDPAIDTLYVPNLEKDSPAAQTEEDAHSAQCHRAILEQLGKVMRLEDVRFYARDLETTSYGTRADLRMLIQLKTITFVVPDHGAQLVQIQKMHFQSARRLVSSLTAQKAFRLRKAEKIRHYPRTEACLLALRNGGKFTIVKPDF